MRAFRDFPAGDGWYAVSGVDGVTVLKNFNGTRLAGMTSAEVTAFSVAQKYAGKQFILFPRRQSIRRRHK